MSELDRAPNGSGEDEGEDERTRDRGRDENETENVNETEDEDKDEDDGRMRKGTGGSSPLTDSTSAAQNQIGGCCYGCGGKTWKGQRRSGGRWRRTGRHLMACHNVTAPGHDSHERCRRFECLDGDTWAWCGAGVLGRGPRA